MKRVKIILGILTILTINSMHSQQDPQYTQYMYNMHIINPAYAGSHGTLNIGLLHRTQWVGLDGAPKTTVATINAPIKKNVGLGFSVFADEIGPVKEQNAFVDFSYTIQTSDFGNLAFGVKGGFSFLDALISKLDLGDNEEDDVFKEDIKETYANFGAGAFYYTDKFYVGLSMPNMLNQYHLKKKNGVISSAAEKMHYFLTSGYVFDLNDNLKLKPSVMLKGVTGSPLSIDVSGNVLINEKLEFGLAWRVDDSVSALVNMEVAPLVRVGYAYDYTTTNLGDYNSGSHEVILLITISNSRAGLSPRFF
ncbi:type IX secretion system membrane protein PorP/SprF [Lutibacter sp. B1]|uniref:PorP/SprF family type IX secretion system membrane protein n=1 Tax=Lutibacter sp. B1 TaxID=2725996 RepID=UPI001456F2C0|nr:type IX secretion system membrane protein PorP/SprF [Lutibacter sp. B1]NLP58380.1 type IX secretion system membrane protein PorP/SprF [Lutibacter sp. B1]